MKKKQQLLILSLVILLTSCAGIEPAPPTGMIYTIDTINGRALGVPFPARQVSQTPIKFVELREVNGWVAFPPESWQAIEAYIIEMRQHARQCE